METCDGCGRSAPEQSLTTVMDVRKSEGRVHRRTLCSSCAAEFVRAQKAQGKYMLEVKKSPGQGFETASGPYDFLGKIMLSAHASLSEVRLLGKPKDFILVFGDGTKLEPRKESQRKDWYLAHRELLLKYLNAGYGNDPRAGGDPLNVLAFGYSGTGSQNLAVLLQSCGFKDTTVVTTEQESDRFPVVLRPDGSLFTVGGELIDIERERQNRDASAAQRRAEEDRRRADEQQRKKETEAKREAEELRKRQIMQQRKTMAKCVMCGTPMGMLERLRRGDRHRRCGSFLE
jgi:hypothetical protein